MYNVQIKTENVVQGENEDVYVLVKSAHNWADEIDVEGFRITTKDVWEEYCKQVEDDYENGEFHIIGFSIGSNQEIEYNSLDEYFGHFTVTEIDEETYTTLRSLFPWGRIGNFHCIEW